MAVAALLLAGAAPAATPDPAHAVPASAADKLRESMLVPGVSLAEGVSEVTGVAISPLLGMSAMGAWTYYRTEPALRHRLPWYCHPWVWGAGLSLIGVCFLKDFLGAAAPALVKKPLDFLELFEDKLSALVATVGFVPLVALAVAQVEKMQQQAQEAAGAAAQALAPGAAALPLAMAPAPPLLGLLDFAAHTPWITIPVAIVGFIIVWLSSHAFNVLIAISPFGMVDAGLKLAKLALITLVAGSTAIHPYAGAAVSLVLLVIAFFIAGWSFRLSVFGTLMGADFLLNRRATAADVDESVKGFLARRMDGVPVRTLARLKLDASGRPVLAYRPWLVLPERHLPLSEEHLVLRKGLIHSSLTHRPAADDGASARNALILLPRYRRLEELICRRFGCQEVVDGTLLKGLKAVRQWLVSMLSGGRRLVEG